MRQLNYGTIANEGAQVGTTVQINVGVRIVENADGTFTVQKVINSQTIIDGKVVNETPYKVREEFEFQ